MDTKSRFANLRLFKLNGTSGYSSQSQPAPSLSPPLPPPKDRDGRSNIFLYTSSSVGATSTPDLSFNSMRSASSDYPRFQSPVSPFVQQASTSASTSSLVSPATALRKGLTKLSSLGRRGTKSTKIPHSPSLNVLPECNDEGISTPYNFQHNIHVNDNLQGMPPSWVSTLHAAGYTEEEINRLRVLGRERAATRYAADPSSSTYPSAYATVRNYVSSPSTSQFGELYGSPPTLNLPSTSTYAQINYNNPSRSTSILSNSARSPSPSNSRESSSHAIQQPLLSPLYTQNFPGYASSSHSHQTYSQSEYGDQTTRSHSPTEAGSPAPTDAVTYSQQSSAFYSDRRGAVTPPINTYTPSGTMYRVVNEDPTPTTPPPAYASPNSPYRTHEKGVEKAFRWDAPTIMSGDGPSGSRNSEPNASLALRHSTYKPPITFDSQPYQSMHVANQTPESELAAGSSSPEQLMTADTNTDLEPLPCSNSQAETVVQDNHDTNEVESDRHSFKQSPPLTPSPTNESLALSTPSRSETPVNSNTAKPSISPPPTLAAPPRLSLHTDQDDDWSMMLTSLSFAGNNANTDTKVADHNLTNPSESIVARSTSPLTPKSKHTARRSSIIYGPRRSPSVKENIHRGGPGFSGQTQQDMRLLLEGSATSFNGIHSFVENEIPEQESEDWADNYLDMKDGDYEEAASYASNLSQSQESFSEEGFERANVRDSQNGHDESSLDKAPLLSPSPSYNGGHQEGIKLRSEEPSFGTRSSVDADIHTPSVVPQSRFSDITVHSSPHAIERSLPSPPSSQLNFVQTTSPKLGPPMSPSAPLYSPTLSPTSAIRRASVLSRRSFDLPPPLPPPEDDLPLTPVEAAAMRLMNNSPAKPSHVTLGGSMPANLSEGDDQSTESPSITTPQRPLSLTSSVHPIASSPKRGLPPVPLQLTMGVKLTQIPLSSISSISSHNRSASGFSSSNPMTARPPPLPMPPTGKVLPSVIMQQRRAAAAANGDAPIKGVTGASRLNLTPSPSTSTFSHSSGYSAVVSDTTPDEAVPLAEVGSTTASQLPAKALKSPSEAVNRGLPVPFSASITDDETIHVQNAMVSRRGSDHGWLPNEASQTEDVESTQQDNVSPQTTAQSHADSVAEPPSSAGPLTPSIAVNGFALPAIRDSTSVPLEFIPKHEGRSPSPPALPLVLYPIKEYISVGLDPLEIFVELQEVAQGQYGSVYAAQVRSDGEYGMAVAVKKVPIPIKGTPKIGQLKRELTLMQKIRHKHILGAESLFYESAENVLWVRMELMERSLADILVLGEEGLEIEERMIARFASDILLALSYLNEQGISHRDLRSDNLLMSGDGILKLADLSNAVEVPKSNSIRLDIVGIHHWQAPEIRSGRYDALKIDVWSLGATVWECAEYVPPFSDIEDPNALASRWPPLSRADDFSKDFHDFLRLCSEPAASRPPPSRLLRHPFVQTACPRVDILSLLNQCRSIEEAMQNGD